MFIPAEYLMSNEAVQRVARSLAPDVFALDARAAAEPENFDRRHRATSDAQDRLLQALSGGALVAALLDRKSGALVGVPAHVWRSESGREALYWSRLALDMPDGSTLEGAVVIVERQLGKWIEPQESAKVPQSVVDAAALGLAEAHFRQHHDKPFKPDIVAALEADGYGTKAAEGAYGSLPSRLRRGRGEHRAKTARDGGKRP